MAEAACSSGFSRDISNHFRSLPADIRKRYEEKISLIDGRDPYSISSAEWSFGTEEFPELTYLNMVNYLVFSKSAYTFIDFEAYKSLDAYNQFACGWVRNIKTKTFGDYVLISGKVLHSQKTSETPLNPWIIANKNGSVSSAHCDCMAGLGEACSHVAAVLFYVEYSVRFKNNKSVTDVPAYWSVPAFQRVPFARLEDTNFMVPKRKCSTEGGPMVAGKTKSKNKQAVPVQTIDEFNTFISELNDTGHPSAILSLIEPYCNKFLSNLECMAPKNLQSLYKEENSKLTYEELLSLGNTVNITVSEEDIIQIERDTRKQSMCKNWYVCRAGRITASNFRAVCKVKSPTSSPSLIKLICYPEKHVFKSKATEWGCFHEKVALEQYIDYVSSVHKNFIFEKSGFLVNKLFPYFGATPDGLVSCICCGKGCVEVKCPYTVKDCNLEDVSVSCLEARPDGNFYLKNSHAYFYQVQFQLFVTDLYCDFVVWTNRSMHVERIYKNDNFLKEELPKATEFFKCAVLPELLGKYLTREKENLVVQPEEETDDGQWCICQKAKGGRMISCSEEGCPTLWYHLKCLSIKKVPKGHWFCERCKGKKSKR